MKLAGENVWQTPVSVLSVNRMAAGSSLSRFNHGFFLLPFSNMIFGNISEQAIGSSIPQTLNL